MTSNNYNNGRIIEFSTADRLKLPGVLFEPKKKTKKALIYLHGNGTSSVFYSLARLIPQAGLLNKIGFSYLAFNNRGAYQYHKIYRDKNRKGKKEKVFAGTAFELIKDCIKDIDGAISFLRKRGYEKIYLIGFSTGANKICVYNYYKTINKVSGYVLTCGGDDSGIFYRALGKKKFKILLSKAKRAIKQGKGKELVPRNLLSSVYSYRSIYDTINPDGDYNTFPYTDYFNNLKLAKKKLFRHYQSIRKPTLVIYGDKDEYVYGKLPEIIEVLKEKSSDIEKFKFSIIKGADHGFTGKNKELNKIIIDWLRKL